MDLFSPDMQYQMHTYLLGGIVLLHEELSF